MTVNSNSRRGSLIPGSRRGSGVSLGGVERRGSYYSDDVSKKATVAMVVDGELVDGKDSIFDMGKSWRFLFLHKYYGTRKLWASIYEITNYNRIVGCMIFWLVLLNIL